MLVFRTLILSLVILATRPMVWAQTESINDAALWLTINLEKKINDRWDIQLNQHNRIGENMTTYTRGNLDLGAKYHFNKSLKMMGGYVFIKNRRLDNSYATNHFLYLAVAAKKEYKNWELTYRNLVQARFRDFNTSETWNMPVWYERNKLTLSYQINKRYEGYVAQELYYPLNQTRTKGFDRSRSFGGLIYKVNKDVKVDFYFLFQQELNARNATNRDFVYGISYNQEF